MPENTCPLCWLSFDTEDELAGVRPIWWCSVHDAQGVMSDVFKDHADECWVAIWTERAGVCHTRPMALVDRMSGEPPAEEIIAEEGFTRIGRMCPYCLMWSDDDDEACPGSCNESDDIDAVPAKRFRIYKKELTRCGKKWRGHVCVLPAGATSESAPAGTHTHRCLCDVQWVSKHPYTCDPFSGAGNCWCGRNERAKTHAHFPITDEAAEERRLAEYLKQMMTATELAYALRPSDHVVVRSNDLRYLLYRSTFRVRDDDQHRDRDYEVFDRIRTELEGR